jgi:thiopurine S-methyltransferase
MSAGKINGVNMDENYWLNKWHINDIAFHEREISADLIAYFDNLNLKSHDCIFVPLCGKSKDMLWFAEKGLHVIGVELSTIACHDFFEELNVTPEITKQSTFTKYQYHNIELLCGDLFNLTSADLPIVNAVYDCKALIALPPELRKKYIDHIVNCVGTNIQILLLARESSCQVNPPPYPVSQAEVNLLYSDYFNIQVLKHTAITDIPDRLRKKGYTEIIESVYLMSSNLEVKIK